MRTLILLTLMACPVLAADCYADNVTYDSRTNLDGSITTTGSDGSDYIARPCATCPNPSYSIEGRDADGNYVDGSVRGHATDDGYTTEIDQ